MMRIFLLLIIFGLLPGCITNLARTRWVKASLTTNKKSKSDIQSIDFIQIAKQGHPFYDPSFQKTLDQKTESKLTTGNQLKLLPNHKGFSKKIELIEKAQHSISVATHQIVCDAGGQLFVDKLIAAANRNVTVRVLLEGSFWGEFGSGCSDKLKHSRVQFRRSHNYLLAKSWTLNIHDKIFVMDTDEAITGGQNIGSWWADSNGRDKNFRDTDIWVKGPVTVDMETEFLQLWELSGADPSENLPEKVRIKLKKNAYAEKKQIGQQNYRNWLTSESPGMCRFVHQEPLLETHQVSDAYIELARAAQQQIIFQVPALNSLDFPKNALLFEELDKTAHNPNNQVLLMTNGRGYIGANMLPSPFSYLSAWIFTSQLYDAILDTNIQISMYDYWMHAKLYYFDGLAVAIGSFNLDSSVAIWTESTLICMDDTLIKEAKKLIKNDLFSSKFVPTPIR